MLIAFFTRIAQWSIFLQMDEYKKIFEGSGSCNYFCKIVCEIFSKKCNPFTNTFKKQYSHGMVEVLSK